LVENVRALTEIIIKARPAAVKGKYVRSMTVATTMSPGIDVDPASVDAK
jgi:large subunit ribosomal protein L1